MRIVDLSTLPDRSEGREHLDAALDDIDLGEARRTDSIDEAAAFGLGFPADLDDETLRELAGEIREELEAAMPEDFTVRFEIADAERGPDAGAPTHLE